MDWNELKVNAQELHWITGWNINDCREVFKVNYLPTRVTLEGLKKHLKYVENDPETIGLHFQRTWFKYHDNRDFMLNEPFKDGFFKRTKKIDFLISILPKDQVLEIEDNWRIKQEMLNQQISFK